MYNRFYLSGAMLALPCSSESFSRGFIPVLIWLESWHQHWPFPRRNKMFSADGFFFLTQGWTQGIVFCLFARVFCLFSFWNILANLSISRSFYISLQLHSTCKFATRYPLWSLGIITVFCHPQTHFAHHRLPVFPCMTTAKLPAIPAAACAPPVVTLCLPPPPPLLKVPVTTPGLDFSALHHYMSHETAVPPHKEQQKKSKFAAGTW